MENFYDYLLLKSNLLFESVKDDSYKINQFYILKETADKDKLKEILSNNPHLELFTKAEFNVFKKFRKRLLENILEKFNSSNKNYIYVLKASIKEVNSSYVISLEKNNANNDFTYSFEPIYNKIKEGIVFLKPKRISKNKAITDLDNLHQLLKFDTNGDIGIHISYIDQNKIRIICYDYLYYKHFSDEAKNFVFPILFQGQISNLIDKKDYGFQKIPYEGAVINWTSARQDISGRNILYPMLAYFANNNILIADRHSLSKSAKSVWEYFYSKNDIFNKRMPIDDYKNKITLYTTKDDGTIFIDKENSLKINYNYNSDRIKNMSKKEQRNELYDARKDDYYNWAYKLNNNVKNKISQILEILKENHQKNIIKARAENDDFLNNIEKLSDVFFDKTII